MGWQRSRSERGLDTYDGLAAQAARGRSKYGKKIANNTYVRVEDGVVIVKMYATDIFRLHPDGSKDIVLSSWNDSTTTKERLRNMAHVDIGQCHIPPVNGYLTQPDSAMFMKHGYGRTWHAYNPENGGWIHILPDGKVDESTVVPHEVECITEHNKLRSTMVRLGKVANLLYGYAKLADHKAPFAHGTERLDVWLLSRYNVPMAEITMAPLPLIYGTFDQVRPVIRTMMARVRYDIARREGWVAKMLVHDTGKRYDT